MEKNTEDSVIRKNAAKLEVFTDFDGTITLKDLGDEFFIEHGTIEPFHTMLINDEMGIKIYWQKLFENLNPDVNSETFRNFAIEQEFDPNFRKFSDFCNEYNIPISVISDGFDLYIKTVLKRIGCSYKGLFCNEVLSKPGESAGELVPFYPYASESCDCKCASCKRNSILTNADPEKILVYIGDGYSDFCAAEHCDIIFAKKNLAAYCNKNRLPHYPFSTFFDVYRILKNLLKQGKIRIRHQAALKRKKAFEIE